VCTGVIHIGASSFYSCIVEDDRSFTVFDDERIPNAKGRGRTYPELLAKVEEAIARFKPNRDTLTSCVVTSPVPVNRHSGLVGLAPSIQALQDKNLRRDVLHLIQKQLAMKLPIIIENDANAAALRSYQFGVSNGIDYFFHVRLSTGMGGAVVLNGRLFGGATGMAGEIGHVTLQPYGYNCGCGNIGCAETLIGGNALLRSLADHENLAVTNSHFSDILNASDEKLIPVRSELEDMGVYLGIALSSAANLLNPMAISLSGPLLDCNNILAEIANREFRQRVCPGLECRILLDVPTDSDHALAGLAVSRTYLSESGD
jgi:predicted NBD/HSP70 family sugar kinase